MICPVYYSLPMVLGVLLYYNKICAEVVIRARNYSSIIIY